MNEFSSDKIRNVHILSRKIDEKNKTTLASLIIQFEHCIASSTVRSNVLKLHCEKNKMIREYMVRGSTDTIFYAEKSLDRSLIYKFEFH